jgi:hypothetical protein
MGWIILAGYGMEALARRYLRTQPGGAGFQAQAGPGKAWGFERKWSVFTLALIGASILGLLLMQHFKPALMNYLEYEEFTSSLSVEVVNFALSQIVWFIVFLSLSAGLLVAITKGVWTGSTANIAWTLLAVLMIADMARSDVPWIRYYDYSEKYSPNPIVELLQDKPYEHRVIGRLEPRGPGSGITTGFGELYFFWLQNDFPYHNIQTLDFSQMPRIPELERAYLKAFELQGSDIRTTDLWPAMRLWQLTNTRYILSQASIMELLNTKVDPTHHSFRIQNLFDVHRKAEASAMVDFGDLTAEIGPKGAYALVDYTQTLPRAKLFSNWETTTNDADTLRKLTSRQFDPTTTVMVWNNHPLPAAPGSPTTDPGTVAITQYHPKRVQLQAEVKTPSVLLLNDRIGADWKLWIDQKPAPILRCNYIMRGAYLTPGSHTIDFRFQPSLNTLYVTLSAFVVGLALTGFLIATRGTAAAAAPRPEPPSTPPAPIQPPPSPKATTPPVKQKGKKAPQPKAGPRRKS